MMNQNEVLDEVEAYVNQHQPATYRLDVMRGIIAMSWKT